jgi:putative NADH-flavin reductase
MQVTIFGASGKVGSLVVAEALQRGYRVVVFVHSHNPYEPNDNLIVRKGDVYSADDVAAAIRGSDAVISCLGSWGTKGRDVLSRFTQNVIPAMEAQRMTRLVTLTGIGVRVHPSKFLLGGLRLLRWLPAGKVFADAETHMQLLVESDLAWTTICSPVMNNWGSAAYRLSSNIGWPLATIHRKAVAVALLDQIASTTYVGQALVIHRR